MPTTTATKPATKPPAAAAQTPKQATKPKPPAKWTPVPARTPARTPVPRLIRHAPSIERLACGFRCTCACRQWISAQAPTRPAALNLYTSHVHDARFRALIGRVMLTARQLEVLELVADGLTDDQIGIRLSVTGKTIHTHLGDIRARLHAANRTHAVVLAIRLGLLEIPVEGPVGVGAILADADTTPERRVGA